MKLQDFRTALLLGANPHSGVSGLCGRLIRGKKPEDFRTLTDDPDRKIVMLVGPDGLNALLDKNGWDMLMTIGYKPDYAKHKIEEGCQFKLVVFPEGGPAKLATWDNAIDTVAEIYPDAAKPLRKWRGALKATPFSELERQAGFTFLDVEKAGKTDSRFMTYDRFIASAQTLADTRAFLYFTIHLRELFRGDGYTDHHGNRGPMEYLVPNRPLTELGEHDLIDIPVSIPATLIGAAGGSMQTKVALPIPGHFDPRTVGEIRRVPYQQLVPQARDWAKHQGIKPAASDRFRICLMPIDCQNTFCIPGFELFVAGASGTAAVEDNVRLCEFIYRNLGTITDTAPTMDTHTAMQIFHEIFLVNDRGEHPAPMTAISLEDVENGVWRVNPAIAYSIAKGNYVGLQRHLLHYARKLSQGGKYALMIWPYHSMLGGIGHALVPAVEEALFFHNMARNSQTSFEIKGGHPLVESYSILKPEVTEGADGEVIAQRNTRFFEKLMSYDAIIGAGQAKSHCFAWTIDDLLTEIMAKDPALAKKVYLLEDCTSPIVVPGVIDFTPMANEAFDRFAKAGMHIVRSTDPIATWPGINL